METRSSDGDRGVAEVRDRIAQTRVPPADAPLRATAPDTPAPTSPRDVILVPGGSRPPGAPQPIQVASPAYARVEAAQPVPALSIGLAAIALLGIGLLIVALLAANNLIDGWNSPPAAVQADSRAVPLGAAVFAEVSVVMVVGNLQLAGGADDLLNATFRYDVPAWKPIVRYSVDGTAGNLSILTPETHTSGTNRYDWELRLKNGVPMRLMVALGAANGDIRLAGLDVSRLVVSGGTGTTTVDLTGPRRQDLDVTIEAGASKTVVRLPRDTGARVTTRAGFGQVQADGLIAQGNVYTNDAYGRSPATVHVDVTVGAGQIILEQPR